MKRLPTSVFLDQDKAAAHPGAWRALIAQHCCDQRKRSVDEYSFILDQERLDVSGLGQLALGEEPGHSREMRLKIVTVAALMVIPEDGETFLRVKRLQRVDIAVVEALIIGSYEAQSAAFISAYHLLSPFPHQTSHHACFHDVCLESFAS